jgi:micrococcal nuclease
LVFLAPSSRAAEKPQELFYIVKRVVDGDTVVLATGEKVRLIGIDTPESRQNRKLKRDMERTRQDADTIIALGKRSAQFTRTLTEGKKVRLEFDVEKQDRYGRTLAYLYAEDGTFVNAEIIREGYAMVLTVPPNVKYKDLFVKLQKEAREAKRGLWRTTPIKTR